MNLNKKFLPSSSRRKARSISPEKLRLMVEFFPEIAIKSPNSLLGNEISEIISKAKNYNQICLEIGFGSGEHLLFQAENNPDNLYLASEVFYNSICATTLKIYNKKISNIRIFDGDARYLLEALKFLNKNILSKIFLLFPDPWPKERHQKRRLVNQETINLFHSALSDNGIVRVASDHPIYCNWCLEQFSLSNKFQLLNNLENLAELPVGYTITKYHEKAINEGRIAKFMDFRKL